ncbi:hypothetical protein TD95_002628 [Thielaviopsis punctulata]|uniref:Major facilitator superfamily (MFS) profile domain-containing protein n=1 Tax=Thielaviopsis punctulata TaxID=72032 RepID=A0A0F4ZK47_9PEZI|nr:hypothetical protein TD95_002628 [Thielaviopsis punctulata]
MAPDDSDDTHIGPGPGPGPASDLEKSAADSTSAPAHAPPYTVYTLWQKRLIVLGCSIAAFFSPMTQQIYYPALPTLASTFHVTDSQINLTVSTYMIFQGLTPMFLGNLSDSMGRRPTYMVCFTVYIAANIGLALAPNYASLLVLRCLQAAGGSSTISLAFAVVADVVTSAERGAFIGFTALPIVLAPAIGPVIGGVLAQYLGWRAIFWYLVIFSGVVMVALFLVFPETCRKITGDGSITPPRLNRTGYALIKDALGKSSTTAVAAAAPPPRAKLTLPNPLPSIMILTEKELGLLLFNSAVVYSGFYTISTALPSQFRKIYGLNDVQTGLMFLPMAAGSTVTAAIVGPLMNWNYRRHCAALHIPYDRLRQQNLAGFPIERARLEVGLPLMALAALTIIAWGWVVHVQAPLAVPCVLMFVLGVGLVGYNNTSNALVVDVNQSRAGAASASNNLTRCLFGAGASAAILPLIEAIGIQWAFTIIGSLYFVASPMLFAVMKHGVRWRAEIAEKKLAGK